MPSKKKKHSQPAPRIRYIALFAFSVLAVGATFYHYVEKLSWLDSFYFSVITLTTVGYGDITPHTNAGKIFTIFYVLIGIAILGASVNYILRRRVATRMERIQGEDDDGTPTLSGYSSS